MGEAKAKYRTINNAVKTVCKTKKMFKQQIRSTKAAKKGSSKALYGIIKTFSTMSTYNTVPIKKDWKTFPILR